MSNSILEVVTIICKKDIIEVLLKTHGSHNKNFVTVNLNTVLAEAKYWNRLSVNDKATLQLHQDILAKKQPGVLYRGEAGGEGGAG